MTEVAEYRELLLGAGRKRDKRYSASVLHPRTWRGTPVAVDLNMAVDPDIWADLNQPPPWRGQARGSRVWREFEADYWDEVHAYEVLEHLGQQGDAVAFFAHFQEIWRILKANGYLVATVPSRFSGWLWGDPSHRRVILPESLTFLDQLEYARQCDGPERVRTSMSDFRNFYKGDFRVVDSTDNRDKFVFVLQAIKPSRLIEPK